MRTFAFLALLPLLAACGGSSDPGVGGGVVVGNPDAGGAVTINWTLAAETNTVVTTVDAGTPVRWHNSDGTTHTVEPDSAPPPSSIPSIGPSATSAAQTITTPGTYRYHCAIHPAMRGTLIVQ
jgi:plastocyanin